MPSQQDILSLVDLLRPHDSGKPKVRIGSRGDGGYVLPDDLEGLDGVVSLGIDNEVSFDRHFADRGIDVHQYDHSIPWGPQSHPHLKFNRLAWGAMNTPATRNLDGIVSDNRLMKARDMILKFDVEGAEWECIPASKSSMLRRFRIIVAELHGLTKIERPADFAVVKKTLELISQTHTAVHIHPNNCCPVALVVGVPLPAVLEVTWLRKDRGTFVPSNDPIPSALDAPNVPENPEIILTPWLPRPTLNVAGN